MQNLREEVGASLVDFNTWLNSLPAYNLNAGTDTLLDQAREINECGKFYFMASPFPTGSNTTFSAYQTQNGSITIQPYAFVVSMSVYCSDPAGIKFSIYDKGAKTYLFQTIYTKDATISSNLQDYTYGSVDKPTGPYFLTSPLIILPPGVLQVEVTSLSSNNNVIAQLCLNCAVPINPKSINVNVPSSSTS